MHVLDEVENLPLWHGVHGAEPIEALYVPEVHNVHVPPSGPAKPLLQRQELELLLPTIELVSKGQSMHVLEFVAPVASEYLPPIHFVHDVTASNCEYVPAAQSVQRDRALAYFPEGHAAASTKRQWSCLLSCSLPRSLFVTKLPKAH